MAGAKTFGLQGDASKDIVAVHMDGNGSTGVSNRGARDKTMGPYGIAHENGRQLGKRCYTSCARWGWPAPMTLDGKRPTAPGP